MTKIQTLNRNYFQIKKEMLEAAAKCKGVQGFLVKCKTGQGENLNNLVTAVGTAGVAPIFIINNPLAKEDKQTKEYTAARQPISAIITLAFQLPIMNAYNKMLDRIATTYHLDRCDLSAKPQKSYLEDLVNFEYKVYKDSFNPKTDGKMIPKQEFRKTRVEDKQGKAFQAQLREIRLAALHNTPFPDFFARQLNNGKIPDRLLIAPADVENAQKELFATYMKEKYNINVADYSMKSIKDLDKKKNVKKLKEAGIEINKAVKKEIKEYIAQNTDRIAMRDINSLMHSHAKIKLYTSLEARKAQEELREYQRQLLINKTPKEEISRLLDIKNDELMDGIMERAKALRDAAPETVAPDSKVMNKLEAETLVEKLRLKLDSPKREDHLVNHLKTEHGTTYETALRSVRIKKWLTSRINHSEKFLSDFKQKSGLVVGLAILPFSCGLLNWAYPRIMEEWFPELAHSKANSDKKPVPEFVPPQIKMPNIFTRSNVFKGFESMLGQNNTPVNTPEKEKEVRA